MEYLMSYGWAILIIAVVLGVLFQLGVFSGSALAPKAQPGSCSVQRLLGQVSLEGECQGQLPQFVGQFNGQSSYISITPASQFQTEKETITAWIYLNIIPTNNAGIVTGTPQTCGLLSLFPHSDCHIQACIGNGVAHDTNFCASPDTWYFVVGWVNNQQGGFQYYGIYINGTSDFNASYSGNAPSYISLYIGEFSQQAAFFPGSIADVQIYNTTLSANEIKALYLEGIGGAPIRLQNLVGWWPLNGNAQDYSGNNQNGQISGGISFNSTWNSQYTPP